MYGICLALMSLLFVAGTALCDDLNCLTERERAGFNTYALLQRQAYEALDRRAEVVAQLQSAEQIRDYQQRMRAFFIEQLGGFPKRNPLNAITVKTIEADGYTIENVIFESQPRHRVTANLYLPTADRPVPGVVVSSGHSRTGKTADYNQRFGIMLAKHGMAALCFDPIGQGERSQLLDENGEPQHSGTTTEHFLIGIGSTLVGRNTATYRIGDAMRAIDYLQARPEIDREKIGMTGCSGGGTLTSYVMALDDRVLCAAPSCYITNFRRLIETIGPQDAEQNIYGQLAFGMDQPDYVLMRAPRPTLISSTTNDFFPIQGSWEAFREAKQIYGKLGFPERVDLVEMPGKHGVQPENLAMIAHWMQRWLLEKDEPVDAVELTTREPRELWCTVTGQVLTSFDDERSVYDLNAEYAEKLKQRRDELWRTATSEELKQKIRDLLAIRPLDEIGEPTWEERGRVERDGYHIDKGVITLKSGARLPALTFHPPSANEDAYLYLHDDGKLGAVEEIEKLVEQRFVVVAVDLSSQGELAWEKRTELLTDWKSSYMAYLLGKPLVGLRVEETIACGQLVANYERPENDPREVHLVGSGHAGIIALMAAALGEQSFASFELKSPPADWSHVVSNREISGELEFVVHGALKLFDWPQLRTLTENSNAE